MKNRAKRLLAWVLTICMVFAAPVCVFAKESEPLEGSKGSSLLSEEENRWEIKVSVPGTEIEQGAHDEIIVVLDGSYSNDEEWGNMKAAMGEIAGQLLDGEGKTQMTILTFGMGENMVAEHLKSREEVMAQLPELPGGLLYGRSSTNCEAGFLGAVRYLQQHEAEQPGMLKEAHVLYISDMGVNTDETPAVFYNWRERTWSYYTWEAAAFGALLDGEWYDVSRGKAVFSSATKEIFGEVSADEFIQMYENGELSLEEALAWVDLVWADVYEYAGLDPEEAYPVSVAERAFVAYDKEYGTHIREVFYNFLAGRGYSNRDARTIAAAQQLAGMEQVETLSLIRYKTLGGVYHEKSGWFKNVKGNLENLQCLDAGKVAEMMQDLKPILEQIGNLPASNAVVTDYMSKWADLDPSTLKVVDNHNGQVIWTAAEGWLIEESARPTAQEVPVVAELVDPADYEAGGADVMGNVSGDIYKLTWYVKDEGLYRSDNYSLVYEVLVDVEEEGFEYNKDYPSNGNTYLEYLNPEGEPKKSDISVPEMLAIGDEVLGDTTPPTGDASLLWFYAAAMLLSAGVMAVCRKKYH